jgi:hypothetical protein
VESTANTNSYRVLERLPFMSKSSSDAVSQRRLISTTKAAERLNVSPGTIPAVHCRWNPTGLLHCRHAAAQGRRQRRKRANHHD